MFKIFRIFRSRWVRWPLIVFGVFAVVSATYVFISRQWVRSNGLRERDAVVARLDADQPGWRWQDLEAARGKTPDADSRDGLSTRLTAALKGAADDDFIRARKLIGTIEPVNEQYDEIDRQFVLTVLDRWDISLPLAMELKNGPSLIRRTTLAPDIYSTVLADMNGMDRASVLLGVECERLANSGESDAAMDLLGAMLNASRSIGDEPFRVAQGRRMDGAKRVAWQAERVLALGRPTRELGELQKALLSESRVDFALTAFRGERAIAHEQYQAIESGKADVRALIRRVPLRSRIPSLLTLPHSDAEWWLFEKYIPHNHAETLDWLDRACSACRQPETTHRSAAIQLAASVPDYTRKNLLFHLTAMQPDVFLLGQLSTRSCLRCAATGLAVERFRQKFGRWPESLDEIPKDILPEIPLDPFEGLPLKLAKSRDGVTVMNSGFPLAESFARMEYEPSDGRFRLFDLDQRGLASGTSLRRLVDEEPELGPLPRVVKDRK